MILYKKSPLIVEIEWEQKMFTTMEKRDLILKTPRAIFNMQMQRRKVRFIKNVSDLTSFSQDFFFGFIFFRTLIPVILFPETLLAAPILF